MLAVVATCQATSINILRALLLATVALSMPVHYSYIMYFKQLTFSLSKRYQETGLLYGEAARRIIFCNSRLPRCHPIMAQAHSICITLDLSISVGVEHLIRQNQVMLHPGQLMNFWVLLFNRQFWRFPLWEISAELFFSHLVNHSAATTTTTKKTHRPMVLNLLFGFLVLPGRAPCPVA